MLNGLDLFSGIGGLSIALSPWVIPRAYCEKEPYAQAVLLSRMRDGSIPWAPIWDDVRSLSERMVGPEIDIIYGGFPCQDRSVAGARKGLAGKQSSLFYEIARLTKEIKPTFVFIENPRGTRGDVEEMRSTFRALKYNTRAGALAAAEIGANHGRDRLWILAHSNGVELREQSGWRRRPGRENQEINFRSHWWSAEPRISRVANGLPFRMDRHRALGNAVVPLQAREAFMRLAGLK